jgi:small subunit ribosomal protein S13
MIRIAGVVINEKKQARFALTPIKGIGKSNVKKILVAVGIEPTVMLGDLTDEVIVKLRNHIEEEYILEADLRRLVQRNIKRLIDINSHRGLRHKAGLPVRGQTTKTNSRTRRGNKKLSLGSGRNKNVK